MKATGIVRKIDKMGRIVLPKELRWRYELDYGDLMEIYSDSNGICLRKYGAETNVMDQAKELHKTVVQMEQELKSTKELQEYLKQVRSKLDQIRED